MVYLKSNICRNISHRPPPPPPPARCNSTENIEFDPGNSFCIKLLVLHKILPLPPPPTVIGYDVVTETGKA
jgi:hypothetical protein